MEFTMVLKMLFYGSAVLLVLAMLVFAGLTAWLTEQGAGWPWAIWSAFPIPMIFWALHRMFSRVI